MSLQKAISDGEGKHVEFKAELPTGHAIAKTVIAFANTAGGKLIIGVNDHGERIGLKPDVDIFELQDQVASIIHESCYPNILPEIYTATIENTILLVIEVYRGNLLPYHLKNKGKEDGVFIRVGATNRKAGPENIRELERQRINVGFDQEVNTDIRYDDLDVQPIAARFQAINKPFDLAVMKNLKLVHDKNGFLYPTNGLLCLLGGFEHVRIKCGRFKGTTMEAFIDRKEYGGDLFQQLDNAEAFIKNHISLRSEIVKMQRTDQYEIPEEAIRESLVNAVVHRDYANEGRDIKVGVYDDMVNIVSPGSFPSTITQEDILEGRSEIRNKVIARVFKELNYIEQWGSGIRRMKASCRSYGLPEPTILEKGDSVDVCLFRRIKNGVEPVYSETNLSEQESMLMVFLESNGNHMTGKQAQQILGVAERRTRSILKAMITKALIERVGNTSRLYYRKRTVLPVTE